VVYPVGAASTQVRYPNTNNWLQVDPRIEMTLMSEVPSRVLVERTPSGRTGVDGRHYPNIGSRSDEEPTRLQEDHLGLRAFLDDPVFEDWATETARIYRVSPLDVLEALARVLVRDGR
jgi:hypothetical protein